MYYRRRTIVLLSQRYRTIWLLRHRPIVPYFGGAIDSGQNGPIRIPNSSLLCFRFVNVHSWRMSRRVNTFGHSFILINATAWK